MTRKSYQTILWMFLLHHTNAVAFTMPKSIMSTNGEELTVPQIINKYGYPVEIFENIQTEDKYLLTLFRIPHGRDDTEKSGRPAVLLVHGFLRTSYDYVFADPERSLAYLLTDRGYDVWLGNVRGTRYSKKHTALKSNNPKYWEFSYYELGTYDLPAFIDKIKNVTGLKKISYIGMSQGTTISYILASERPEYNEDLSIIASLAPVASCKHISSTVLLLLSEFQNLIVLLSQFLGFHEFPPQPLTNFLNGFIKQICRADNKYFDICATMFFLAVGNSPDQLDKVVLQEYVFDGINPVSLRQLINGLQCIKSGDLRLYDFGLGLNMKMYGSPTPSKYNFSKVTAPVALFYSAGDLAAQPGDVEWLCRQLSNCTLQYKVPDQRFNHIDFFTASDVIPLVYEKLFQILDQHN